MAFSIGRSRKKSSAAKKGAFTASSGSAAALPMPAPELPCPAQWQLYEALRSAVPVIDAAFRKIVRLCGGFTVHADDPEAQAFLDRFCECVPVNANGYVVVETMSEVNEGNYVDVDGALIASPHSGRLVGLTIDDLRGIDHVVAIVSGVEKPRAILGVLRAGIVDVLITDETNARTVIGLAQGGDA